VASDDDRFDPRFDPAFQRGYENRPGSTSAVEAVDDEPAAGLRGNPWVVVLWVLAVLFVATGVWALWQSEVQLNSPNLDNVVTFYVFPDIMQALAPWLVGAGLACLVLVVFLHAVSWRRP
jgi:hypothetical protein